MTTRRPRIGLLRTRAGTHTVIEYLDSRGVVTGYAGTLGLDAPSWTADADFTPLGEVPEPRMDEPTETWATVVAKVVAQHPLDVFIRTHDGNWRRCLDGGGGVSSAPYAWSELIDPRPTTPTERATGIVGGEES